MKFEMRYGRAAVVLNRLSLTTCRTTHRNLPIGTTIIFIINLEHVRSCRRDCGCAIALLLLQAYSSRTLLLRKMRTEDKALTAKQFSITEVHNVSM